MLANIQTIPFYLLLLTISCGIDVSDSAKESNSSSILNVSDAIDSDGDLIPDKDEEKNGTNPLIADTDHFSDIRVSRVKVLADEIKGEMNLIHNELDLKHLFINSELAKSSLLLHNPFTFAFKIRHSAFNKYKTFETFKIFTEIQTKKISELTDYSLFLLGKNSFSKIDIHKSVVRNTSNGFDLISTINSSTQLTNLLDKNYLILTLNDGRFLEDIKIKPFIKNFITKNNPTIDKDGKLQYSSLNDDITDPIVRVHSSVRQNHIYSPVYLELDSKLNHSITISKNLLYFSFSSIQYLKHESYSNSGLRAYWPGNYDCYIHQHFVDQSLRPIRESELNDLIKKYLIISDSRGEKIDANKYIVSIFFKDKDVKVALDMSAFIGDQVKISFSPIESKLKSGLTYKGTCNRAIKIGPTMAANYSIPANQHGQGVEFFKSHLQIRNLPYLNYFKGSLVIYQTDTQEAL